MFKLNDLSTNRSGMTYAGQPLRRGVCILKKQALQVNRSKMEDMMNEVFQKTIWQLELLATQRLSIEFALDQLERISYDYCELLIINVLREAFDELMEEESRRKIA